MLHSGHVAQLLDGSVHHGDSHLGTTELSTTIADHDAHHVPLCEESSGALQLHIEVVIIGPGSKLHLFHFDLMLILAGVPCLPLLLVLELPPVHELYNGWASLRSDLDEVEFRFDGPFAGCVDRHDAQLLAVLGDESNGADPDLFVHAGFVDDFSPAWFMWVPISILLHTRSEVPTAIGTGLCTALRLRVTGQDEPSEKKKRADLGRPARCTA